MTFFLDDSLARAMADDTFVAAMAAGIAAFPRYRSFLPLRAGEYTRMLLRKTAQFELVVMQWSPLSFTPIHDHGESHCWIVMLEGELRMENFERMDDGNETVARIVKTSEARYPAGSFDARANWRELHRVTNDSGQHAYSLQLYAAPQTDFTVFDEKTGGYTKAQPHYNAVFDL